MAFTQIQDVFWSEELTGFDSGLEIEGSLIKIYLGLLFELMECLVWCHLQAWGVAGEEWIRTGIRGREENPEYGL